MKNEYEIHGDIVAIKLKSEKYGDKETIISINKLHKMLDFTGTWYLLYTHNHFYVVGKIGLGGKKQKVITLHRLINDTPVGKVVDHINRNTLDNTDENLRNISDAENQQNRSIYKSNKSGYRGVMWNKKHGKWIANLRVLGKLIYIGQFENVEDAHAEVVKARQKYMPFSREA